MLEGVKSRGLGMRVLLVLAAMVLAIFASVATTEERAGAEDVATRVEGENFDVKPTGTSVVTNTTLYAPPQRPGAQVYQQHRDSHQERGDLQ
jgi:hypothetical protein